MTTVKIAFLLDCTASMSYWIQTAKTKISEIVGNVLAQHTDAFVEVGLVAYRDYDDRERFVIRDFTSPDVIRQVLGDIEAEGGGDQAEDVAHAIQHCTGMSWSGADVRMIFHIADAPAHGLAFHKPSVSDRFPEGDPDGLDPRTFLRTLSNQAFVYTFVKITSATDTMLDAFYNAWTGPGVFQVIDLSPQRVGVRHANELFSEEVSSTVNRSIVRHTSSRGT
jgi:hypothetical protein